MKKITFLMILLITSLGYSQVVVQDFGDDTAGGAIPGAGGLFGGASGTVEADPVDPSNLVAEIIASASGNIWQGTNVELDQSVDLTQALPADRTMEIDVYSTSATPISMLVRVTGGPGAGAASEANAVVTHPGGSVWTTLTATFDTAYDGRPVANGVYTALVIYPNWDTTTNNFINPAVARTVYVDNIKGFADTCSNGVQDGTETGVDCGGSCAPCPVPPNVAAPTQPNRAAADVVNLYSGAYAGSQTLTPNVFGQAANTSTAVEGVVAGDNYWEIDNSGQDFMGFDFAAAVDASQMTHFHMNYWTTGQPAAGQVINLTLSNHSAGLLTGQTQAAIHGINPPGVDGQWNTIDIPISAFNIGPVGGGIISPVVNRSILSQLVITASGAAGAQFDNVYFDNVYFHNTVVLSTSDFELENLKVHPNPTNSVWEVEANSVIDTIEVYDILGKRVMTLAPNNQNVTIDGSVLRTGLYLAKLKSGNGTKTLRLLKN